MTRTKIKKQKHLFGRKEFIFNLLSLLATIIVGIYFGCRSFYYYSKQNMSIKQENGTLNGLIIKNNKIVENDGLYRDSNGYYFKGNVQNNYVSFANRIFRVLRVNNDNSVKLVSEDLVSSFIWGEKYNYRFSNLRVWLNNNKEDYLGVYYNTIPNPKKFLVKTAYSEDILKDGKVNITKKVYYDYITTLSIDDYILANGKNSFLNNGKIYYLLGLNAENNNLYVDDDGSIQSCDGLDGFGVRSVITLKSNSLVLSGDGSQNNPFVIEQGEDKNYVDSYVKLGNDIWKIFDDKDGLLKLYICGYANIDGVEIFRNYSTTTSLYDLTNKNNIAYYLNTTYLQSLSYNNLLVDNNYYVGEFSEETGYNYKNIYTKNVSCKIGLLNIFDYISNNYLDDYFHLNTTSSVGGIQYNSFSNGLLEETDIKELKHVVPVISIKSDVIKSGNGTFTEPYIVE